MTKVLNKKYLILGLILGALLLIIIVASSFAFKTKIENNDKWVIRSVENQVVLMNNNEIVEVFGNIVSDSSINGDVVCHGKIDCHEINGDVNAQGDISAYQINSPGKIICNDIKKK